MGYLGAGRTNSQGVRELLPRPKNACGADHPSLGQTLSYAINCGSDRGACNKPCSVAHGEARCSARKCQVARCEAERAIATTMPPMGC